MSDRDLLVAGFSGRGDGTLHAPSGIHVKLVPIGRFYELRISMRNGNTIVAVLDKAAVKITREPKS
jgi:hypothetical protein